MRHWIARSLFSLSLIAAGVLPSFAFAWEAADDMATVQERIAQLAGKHGPERTLIVFDVDNTLLRMNQDLGSDAWYRWQRQLQKTEPASRFLVSPEFADLLDVQKLLYDLSDMQPVEETTLALVDALI